MRKIWKNMTPFFQSLEKITKFGTIKTKYTWDMWRKLCSKIGANNQNLLLHVNTVNIMGRDAVGCSTGSGGSIQKFNKMC